MRHRQLMDRYDVTFYTPRPGTLEPASRGALPARRWHAGARGGAAPSIRWPSSLYQAPAGAPAGTATLRHRLGGGRAAGGPRRCAARGPEATAALAAPAAAGALADARIYYHGTAPHDAGEGSAAIGNGLDRADSVRYARRLAPLSRAAGRLSEPFAAPSGFRASRC
ncbi:MAG: hypothetical protein WKG07_04605 [Hymenobacter sp.]